MTTRRRVCCASIVIWISMRSSAPGARAVRPLLKAKLSLRAGPSGMLVIFSVPNAVMYVLTLFNVVSERELIMYSPSIRTLLLWKRTGLRGAFNVILGAPRLDAWAARSLSLRTLWSAPSGANGTMNASSVTSVATVSVRMAGILCERASPSERLKVGSLGVRSNWLYVSDARASD